MEISHEKTLMENPDLCNVNHMVNIRRTFSQRNSAGCVFHWHEQLEFYYVKSGGVRLNCDNCIRWLYSGDIGFVGWCRPHRGLDFLNDTEHYIIQVDLPLLLSPASFEYNGYYLRQFCESSRSFPVFIYQDKNMQRLFDTLISELEEKKDGYELAVRSILYSVLVLLLRQSYPCERRSQPAESDTDKHIRDILVYIHENYESPISLQELSRHIGLSIPYLCRIFKSSTAATITGYINALRCHRAISFLQNGMSVSETASLVGFSDYNYFSRIFRKIIGCPPSKITKNYK